MVRLVYRPTKLPLLVGPQPPSDRRTSAVCRNVGSSVLQGDITGPAAHLVHNKWPIVVDVSGRADNGRRRWVRRISVPQHRPLSIARARRWRCSTTRRSRRGRANTASSATVCRPTTCCRVTAYKWRFRRASRTLRPSSREVEVQLTSLAYQLSSMAASA